MATTVPACERVFNATQAAGDAFKAVSRLPLPEEFKRHLNDAGTILVYVMAYARSHDYREDQVAQRDAEEELLLSLRQLIGSKKQ